MLNGIDKILTGEILQVLCDMGHGDSIIIADGNFPSGPLAKETVIGHEIRLPGADVSRVLRAILDIFPIDVKYTSHPACVMQLSESDREMGEPAAWTDYRALLTAKYPSLDLFGLERYNFYNATKRAYAIIVTGEERTYGNLLLVKGCVL